MSTLVFANNAASTLSGGLTSTSLTINLAAGGGAAFPNPTSGQYFVATLVDAATGLLREIVWVTGRSGDVFTVQRAQEGTTALNWQPNDLIQHLWTAGQAGAMQQQSTAPSSLIYYGTDTSVVVNAIVATVTPTVSSLNTGAIFEITTAHANTSTTVSFSPNGLGPNLVYRADGTGLVPGDIQAAPFKALISWDATTSKFLLLNPALWDSLANSVYTGTDSGSSGNSYVVASPTPPVVSLIVGSIVEFKAANASAGGASPGSTTLVVGSVSSKSFYRADGSPIRQNDIIPGEMVTAVYDGTGFQLSGVVSASTPPSLQTAQLVHGTYSITIPAGIYKIYVKGVAGGGGGGPGGGPFSDFSGGGGGSGGYFEGTIYTTPGTTISYTVGQGGAGSGTNGTAAGTGGTTSILGMSAVGGGGGQLTFGSGLTTASGGVYGTATGGAINFPGASGGDGNPAVANIQGGAGASSAFGGGGRTTTVGLPGRPDVCNGVAPGSGGGGVWGSGTGNQTGGNGADGAIFIYY
jgi:hypothetical protein